MKWFVYRLMLSKGGSKLMYVNARTEKTAQKRLLYACKRFKIDWQALTLENANRKPIELLAEVWHIYGMAGTMVTPE